MILIMAAEYLAIYDTDAPEISKYYWNHITGHFMGYIGALCSPMGWNNDNIMEGKSVP